MLITLKNKDFRDLYINKIRHPVYNLYCTSEKLNKNNLPFNVLPTAVIVLFFFLLFQESAIPMNTITSRKILRRRTNRRVLRFTR